MALLLFKTPLIRTFILKIKDFHPDHFNDLHARDILGQKVPNPFEGLFKKGFTTLLEFYC